MLMKKPTHRIFDYTPRYYDPEKDERRKKKLGFKRLRKVKSKRRNPFIWLILIIIVAYMFMKLEGGL